MPVFDEMTSEMQQQNFMAMLGRCEGLIYKVCLTYTSRTRESVADLYQEIVCNLWNGYRKFRSESKESTWVWRVAVNTALGMCRHMQTQPQMVEIPAELFDTLAEEQPNGVLQRFYELVDMLDEDERELMMLYLSDATTAEMATVLKCPLRTVERRISRLKQRLKELNEKDV